MNLFENGYILASIAEFLSEDLGRGDITTQACVAPEVRGTGRFLAKENLVVCGLAVVSRAMAEVQYATCHQQRRAVRRDIAEPRAELRVRLIDL